MLECRGWHWRVHVSNQVIQILQLPELWTEEQKQNVFCLPHLFVSCHGIFYSDFKNKRPLMLSSAWQGQKPYKQPLSGQCMQLWRWGCRYNGNSRMWKTFRLGMFSGSSRAVSTIESSYSVRPQEWDLSTFFQNYILVTAFLTSLSSLQTLSIPHPSLLSL